MVGALALAVPALAQNFMQNTAKELDRAGFGFYGVSVFGGYTDTRTPAIDASGNFVPNYDFHSIVTGVSAALGWRSRQSDTWHFVIHYNPSYYYQTSSTGFSRSGFQPGQNLNLSWGKTLGSKWSVGASVDVSASDYNQLLLLSDPNQILAGYPGTPGALAGAVLTGNGASSNLNAVAGGANAIIAGQQNLLYGNYILTASGGASLGYKVSERLRLGASFGVSRMQHLDDNNGPQTPHLLNQSTSFSSGLSMDYLLSPRTNLFASVGYSRALSSLYTTPSVGFAFGAGRTLTEHIFAHASVGMGYILPSAQGSPSIQRTNWQASAGLGYRLYRQSFVGSVSRSVSDNFGLGASSNFAASLGWNWHPPGTDWGISAGGAEQRLNNTPYGRQGYRVMVGVNRALSARVTMSLSYGYGNGSSVLLTSANTLTSPYSTSGHSVRLNIGWSPYLGSPDPVTNFPGQTNPVP